MKQTNSSFPLKLGHLFLLSGLSFLCGCSTFFQSSRPFAASPAPLESYSDLRDQAQEQQEQLIRKDEYRRNLAERLDTEAQALSEKKIATGPLNSRKPYVGPRFNNPK